MQQKQLGRPDGHTIEEVAHVLASLNTLSKNSLNHMKLIWMTFERKQFLKKRSVCAFTITEIESGSERRGSSKGQQLQRA